MPGVELDGLDDKPRGLAGDGDDAPAGEADEAPGADEGRPGWLGIPRLGRGKPLGAKEAREIRGVVIASLRRYGELLDEVIPLASASHSDCSIWGNLSDEEAGIIADMLIELGQRPTAIGIAAANTVRGIARAYAYLEFGMILGSRFQRTVAYYLREGFTLRLRFGKAGA